MQVSAGSVVWRERVERARSAVKQDLGGRPPQPPAEVIREGREERDRDLDLP